MSDNPSLGNDFPAAQLARRVDRLCDRFEAAWKAGQRPHLERYLAKSPPEVQSELLRELLVLELEYRYQRGEKPQPEEYHLRFPQHAELIDTVFSEATQSAPSSPYLLRRWTMSRLVSQLRLLAFPEEQGKDQPPEVLSLLGGILSRTAGEHRRAPGETPLASSELDTPTKLLQLGEEADTKDQGEARPDRETLAVKVLGDYELLDLLGKGGMGIVYRARQRSANRIVALKVIRSDRLEQLSDAERQEWFERFRREAQIAASLDHDNLVAVHEVGQADGRHFYSMRFVDGQSLAEILRKGPLPNQRAAACLEPVARALHALHDRGIVHRDLKPRNILVDRNDRPFVTDFGLAKGPEYARGLTHVGQCVGTPEYMSPEQVRNPADVQAATDLYSLGATLYELLTARPPFTAADPLETLRQVQDEEPLSPRRLNPAVHRDLELICLKCLEKEPQRRYASALELAEELRRYRGGEPLRHTRPVGKAERVWRWCRRKPLQAAFTCLAAFVFMAVAALSISLAFIIQLKEEQKRTQAARREAVRLSTLLALEGGLSPCQQGRVAHGMVTWANQLDTAAEYEDLQRPIRANLAAWYRQLWPLKAIIPDQKDVVYAALSPDGKTVLTVDGQTAGKKGEVRLWDAARAKPIGKPIPHDDEVPVVFSPDGRTILTGSNGFVRRWEATTGEPVGEPYPVNEEVLALAFALDGTTIQAAIKPRYRQSFGIASRAGFLGSPLGQGPFLAAFAHIHRTATLEIRIWRVAAGKYSKLVLMHPDVTAVFFSPDGRRAVTRSPTTAQLWDLNTGDPVCAPLQYPAGSSLKAGPFRSRALALFSPDGQSFVTAGIDGTVWLRDAATGKELHRLEGHEGEIFALAFSHDGKLVLTGSADFTARLWDTATGKRKHTLKGHQDRIEIVALSRDGKMIATGSADGTVRLWDTDTGKQLGAPLTHGGNVTALALNSDAETILTRSSDNNTRLWTAVPARLLGFAPPYSSTVRRVAFSPEGGSLLTHFVLPHTSPVQRVAFSPDGGSVLTCTRSSDHPSAEASLWNVASMERIAGPVQHDGWILAAAFSPDGKKVLTGCTDNKARIWDINTGRLRELRHEGLVSAVAFSADGQTALTGGNDAKARLWNAFTGDLQRELAHPGAVFAVAFSQDSQRVLTGSNDGKARLWDVATGVVLVQFIGHGDIVMAVAFSPDYQRVLTGSYDKTAQLWQAASGTPLGLPLQHQGLVLQVAFNNPDGKILLTASLDKTARLWDAATGMPLGSPVLHGRVVLDTAFSSDGRMVLTGSDDNTARLIDAATAVQIGPVFPHPASVWAVAFSPDGKFALTGCCDNNARLWEIPAPVEGDEERIRFWTRVITGMTQEPNGAFRHLNSEEWNQCRRELEARGGPPLP